MFTLHLFFRFFREQKMKDKRELQCSDLVFSPNPRKLITVAIAGLLTYRRLAPSHD
jgi:hypothetical protein